MIKRFLIALGFTGLLASGSKSQSNGILPLSGLKYFNEGILAKEIDVKVDGARLLSNRLPLNKEIEVVVSQPTGFTADAVKTVYAGAEFILVSPRGDILLRTPNLFLNKEKTGFGSKDLVVLSIKFAITPEMARANMNGTVKLRLYDLKGKNQLRLEMPATFARPGEALQVSKATRAIPVKDGAVGMINGLKAKNMLVSVDTSIRVSPKMAYTSLNISSIEGSSIPGIFQGRENFWVYDDNLNEVKITDILLKQVKGAMENNNVDYTLKIPYRLKNNTAKLYTVRFRWESPDKKQLIDVVVKI
ncbi:MAG TPA: hypothetical protein PK133_08960 [Ferruginibacter sp.]|nr:hypothetical protein [Ferruginibacter sp.]